MSMINNTTTTITTTTTTNNNNNNNSNNIKLKIHQVSLCNKIKRSKWYQNKMQKVY